LRTGECGPQSFDEVNRSDERIARLAAKITVSLDRELDAKLPAHRAARLRVHWVGGQETLVEVENPIGDADFHPLSDSTLLDKSASLLGDPDDAALVHQLCEEMLHCNDVATILGQLRSCASKGGPRAG